MQIFRNNVFLYKGFSFIVFLTIVTLILIVNIKVTIVRQTIQLNYLYTLSTMINIFHDIKLFLLATIMAPLSRDKA